MSDDKLSVLLKELLQREPTAALNALIASKVKELFALEKCKLESYCQAEQLLSNPTVISLDDATKLQLTTVMSQVKNLFGVGFEAAHRQLLAQQDAPANSPDTLAKDDGPSLG